jgi:DNA-binding LytR/AlgR family response regulator
LHVEDEALYTLQLKICLDELGYALLGPAVDAEQAMALFATTEPDLVVLDIGLSGPVDGITLAARMRALRPSVPLLFVTSFTDRATFERARAVGPSAYVSKPFTVPTVQHALELAIQQAHSRPEEALPTGEPETLVVPNRVGNGSGEAAATAAAADSTWPEDVLVRDAFFVKNRDRLLKIYQQDVVAIEASNGLTVLRTANGGQYLLSITLGRLEEKLVGTSFARVHRTWLVNVSLIDEVLLSQSAVRLGALLVPISTGYRPALLRRLQLLT